MRDALGEVLCRSCASYAHPFLGACPVCGMERASLYEAAAAAPDQGLAALELDPRVRREVAEVVLRYSLKVIGSSGAAGLREGFDIVADALAYRVRVAGDPGAGSDRGHLEVGEADLVVSERSPARERVRVPLDAILAASPAVRGRRADAWSGLAFEDRLERTSPPSLDGDLVVAHATPTGLARIALANRAGLLAARARPDHYTILARWVGIAAAAAAERRWTAVGPLRHAHELGLAAAPPGGWPAPVPDAPGTGTAPVADALRLLEELRAAGLLSDGEYAAKRREILDRI
ncbi:MAG: SHOCT domain-containing protein [Chloroflexota bacterium]